MGNRCGGPNGGQVLQSNIAVGQMTDTPRPLPEKAGQRISVDFLDQIAEAIAR